MNIWLCYLHIHFFQMNRCFFRYKLCYENETHNTFLGCIKKYTILFKFILLRVKDFHEKKYEGYWYFTRKKIIQELL